MPDCYLCCKRHIVRAIVCLGAHLRLPHRDRIICAEERSFPGQFFVGGLLFIASVQEDKRQWQLAQRCQL